jgi:hypothetical protein
LNCVLLQQGEESEGEQVGAESVHQYQIGGDVKGSVFGVPLDSICKNKRFVILHTTSRLLIYIDNLSPVQCLHQLVAFAFPEP